MNSIFLDTVGLIALWDDTDQWHSAAAQAYGKLRAIKFHGITTNAILLECGNAAARRPYRRHVNLLRRELESRSRLIYLTDDDWQQAWESYDRNEAGGASIVDHTSFVIMARLGIRQAFTNDRHFATAGFEVLF